MAEPASVFFEFDGLKSSLHRHAETITNLLLCVAWKPHGGVGPHLRLNFSGFAGRGERSPDQLSYGFVQNLTCDIPKGGFYSSNSCDRYSPAPPKASG